MTGGWRAVAGRSVRYEELRSLLEEAGTGWEDADHVTATTSLAAAMRTGSGRVALPVATLLDLITLPAHPDGRALPIEGFPGQVQLDEDARLYAGRYRDWQAAASGRRFRIAFDMHQSLRAFAKEGDLPTEVGRLLVGARQELSKSVASLVAAGVEPADLDPGDPVAIAAVAAWSRMETDVPAMTTLRRTVWFDKDELAGGRTQEARELLRRIQDALSTAFAPRPVGRRRTVVHHGFYFFTPPQWALFQLLRAVPDLDQVFVLHDDGIDPVFKTWRIFFSENEWDMPRVEHRASASGTTLPATAYSGAMRGLPVDAPGLQGGLAVVAYRNVAEFVRDWRTSTASGTTFHSADAQVVSRFVRRLDRDAPNDRVDLSGLPVGVFLLAAHGCIHKPVGEPTRVRVTKDALLDMVGSGFLDVGDVDTSAALDVLARAITFFGGCDDGHQWVERAQALRRLVRDEVAALGARDDGHDDLERIRAAVENPLRRVPWADLSLKEADLLFTLVKAAVEVVDEIAAGEEVSLNQHLDRLRVRLEQGLRALPADDAAEVLGKFHGFSDMRDVRVDVADLIDVVRMVLGQHPDLDVTGEESERLDVPVRELRSLDALGFSPSDGSLHLANLADGSFPSRVSAVGWPFRPADLDGEQCTAAPVALEILQTRALHAGQSDVYLLHLGLDGARQPDASGVPSSAGITLSWIEELGGELVNASSLVTLLTRPERVPGGLAEHVGGVEVRRAEDIVLADPRREGLLPAARTTAPADLEKAAALLDGRAAAAALACRRRFALQWGMGTTAAFRAEHHQTILFGNVLGALQRLGLRPVAEAQRVCDDLWRHLTPGERRSSQAWSRVLPAKASADPVWLLTLEGRKAGTSPVHRAYNAARTGAAVPPDALASAADGFLPPGVDDPAVCGGCPVKDRCLDAALDRG